MPIQQTYYSVRHHPPSDECGLPPGREFVFGGFFLMWLVMKGLVSDDFVALVGNKAIGDVKKRKLSGAQLLEHVDGIMESTMVTEQAHWFCSNYFDLMNEGQYLEDFKAEFAIKGRMTTDLYVVANSWKNYDRMAPRIDAAYEAWNDLQPK